MQRLLSSSGFFYKSNGPDGLNAAEPYIPPFSPADLPNVLGWYDASESSTVIVSAGRVSAWNSRLGSNHLTQAVTAKQPVVSGSTLNSKSLIYYDGSDRWMTLGSRMTNVATAAILCKWADTTGDYRSLFGDNSTYPFHGAVASGGTLLDPLYSDAAVRNGQKYINGTNTATPTRYTTWTRHVFAPLSNIALASFSSERDIPGRGFKGDVAEIIFMSSTITLGDLAKLEAYWQSKYSLP